MKYKITLQNKVYEVEVEKGNATLLDEYEAKAPVAATPVVAAPVATPAPVAAAPSAPAATGKGKPVPAPLGGLVVAIKCQIGDTLKAGQVFAIVEAMKMENDINAPFDGKVVAINITKGQTIQSGNVMIELA